MARKENIRRFGFARCTTLKDLSKPAGEQPSSRRTPYHLTTTELLKKLCSRGPDGCNENCENWGVCLYGKAWAERRKTLQVRAEITLNDGEIIVRYFIGEKDVEAWKERHRGHFKSIETKCIRLGRETACNESHQNK